MNWRRFNRPHLEVLPGLDTSDPKPQSPVGSDPRVHNLRVFPVPQTEVERLRHESSPSNEQPLILFPGTDHSTQPLRRDNIRIITHGTWQTYLITWLAAEEFDTPKGAELRPGMYVEKMIRRFVSFRDRHQTFNFSCTLECLLLRSSPNHIAHYGHVLAPFRGDMGSECQVLAFVAHEG